MDLAGGVEGGQFAGVRAEVCVGYVAEVEGCGAVGGEVVGCCAADAEGAVAAREDGDAVGSAAAVVGGEG